MEKIVTDISNNSNCNNLINITLLDENINFKKISPFKIHKSLNIISETWDWVRYTNNYKTLTITEKTEVY